jgi:hypothetical protein
VAKIDAYATQVETTVARIATAGMIAALPLSALAEPPAPAQGRHLPERIPRERRLLRADE